MRQHVTHLFEAVNLETLATQNHKAYAQAQPFSHIIFDDFLPAEMLQSVLDEFPRSEQIDWIKYDSETEKKLGSEETHIKEYTRLLLCQFNSSPFINFLEILTGIHGLIPDPHYWGGGLHQITRGGFLKIHADFNWYERLRLDRRLNLLLYLNKDWKDEYGGHLEFWDRNMKECRARILPIFNRCVIFNTSDFSFHGHPEPLACPEGWTRKSLAIYYYSNGRPTEEKSNKHSTIFKHRPGESF